LDSIVIIAGSSFTNNVSPIGAFIFATFRSMIQHIHSFLLVSNNMADRYAVIYLSDSEFIQFGGDSVNATFSNNLGSLVAFNSNITFTGYATFVNNTPSLTVSGDFQEGGAITLLQSNIYFDGECNLEHNHAENGGAIHSTESKLYVNGDVTIAHNTATGNGGGVYLSTSELNCQPESNFELYNNTAVSKGGGLHAIGSSIKAASSTDQYLSNYGRLHYIYTGARIDIRRNAAERGGGLSLEANTKLYILKYNAIIYYYQIKGARNTKLNTTTFTANSADYGGAIHVDDDTNSGTCAKNAKTDCFFQVLALYTDENPFLPQSMNFSQNHANISGSTLYGGLLDRCAVSPFAEVHNKYPHDFKDRGGGIAYFKNVSTPTYYNYRLGLEIVVDTNLSISSSPVQVCLCFNADHNNDCTRQYNYTEVKKGETFTLSVVAVDQIGQPVSATIQTSLHFTESGLAEGQLARRIPAECTNNVVSPHVSENVSLYASDGPCKDAELSSAAVEIDFLPCSCPIGFQESGMNSTNCMCDCDNDISRYIQQCDSHAHWIISQTASI
jgi:predicted outer membrane repeat protein